MSSNRCRMLCRRCRMSSNGRRTSSGRRRTSSNGRRASNDRRLMTSSHRRESSGRRRQASSRRPKSSRRRIGRSHYRRTSSRRRPKASDRRRMSSRRRNAASSRPSIPSLGLVEASSCQVGPSYHPGYVNRHPSNNSKLPSPSTGSGTLSLSKRLTSSATFNSISPSGSHRPGQTIRLKGQAFNAAGAEFRVARQKYPATKPAPGCRDPRP